MRDPKTLQRQLGIDYHGIAEIGLQKQTILIGENLQRKGLIFFDHPVGEGFKLCKHGLPDKGCANVVDFPIQDINAHFRIVTVSVEKISGQQVFIKCRGHLCNEYGVFIIHIGLVVNGKIGMHGVSGLMDQRVEAVHVFFFIIEQNIGW